MQTLFSIRHQKISGVFTKQIDLVYGAMLASEHGKTGVVNSMAALVQVLFCLILEKRALRKSLTASAGLRVVFSVMAPQYPLVKFSVFRKLLGLPARIRQVVICI